MRAAVGMMLGILLATAPALATSAYADVVQNTDLGFVTGADVEVPGKSPIEVWQALITPARWWNPVHSWSGDAANLTLDPQAGGCFCENLPLPKDAPADLRHGSIEHMRVIAAMPPKLLRMSGALGPLQGEALTGTLTIVLKPLAAGGTHLAWSYVVGGFMRQKRDEIVPLIDRVLTQQFARLADFAVGKTVSPQPPPAALPDDRSDEEHR